MGACMQRLTLNRQIDFAQEEPNLTPLSEQEKQLDRDSLPFFWRPTYRVLRVDRTPLDKQPKCTKMSAHFRERTYPYAVDCFLRGSSSPHTKLRVTLLEQDPFVLE